MKKFRKSLLSVLLFSFSFLVLHDYVMIELSNHHMHEVTFEKPSSELNSECATLDIELQIHDSIHSIVALGIDYTYLPTLLLDLQPLETEICITTHNSLVLERPPLA
jgi:hypothetical protein